MIIPTEPIGSIPRPPEPIAARDGAAMPGERLDALCEAAVRDAVARFEATGSPVISDAEQRKYHNFWTYCMHGSRNTAADGFPIPCEAGHTRRMPRLTRAPFRYERHADDYLRLAPRHATLPVKQAVISPSAPSLMYPSDGLPGYRRAQFIDDLLNEHQAEVRRCLEAGAHKVQVDFTEGRLALKRDPGGADVDYAELLPSLFELKAGNFYIALAGEAAPRRALKIIRQYAKPGQRIFVGVTAPIDPRIETAAQVRERVPQAAGYIPLDQLGTTDDCGFAPFCDDRSTSRATAFAKIGARVEGTALAAAILGERP